MHKNAIIGLSLLALVLLLSVPALAQTSGSTGCCCDYAGDAQTGSAQAETDCDVDHPLFFTLTSEDLFGLSDDEQAAVCDTKCAEAAGIQPALCGNGEIDPGEGCDDGNTADGDGCSSLCEPEPEIPVLGCDAPGFAPQVGGFQANPVRGRKEVLLTFSVPCPADYLNISRCRGDDCTDFELIGLTGPASSFLDNDPLLEFRQDYMYRITAHYPVAGDNAPAFAAGNPGDLECKGRTDEGRFCLTSQFYEGFRDYLTSFGYARFKAQDFRRDFGSAVTAVFGNRFNSDTWCDERNLLQPSSVMCSSGTACISDGTVSRCQRAGPCTQDGGPFNLFFTPESCEGQGFAKNYCFFDRSSTIINDCFTCHPRMTCYDYKSRRACEADNCGAGLCEWHPTFADLGAGVCVDTRIDNCPLCASFGSGFVGTSESASRVFDACSATKADALSTGEFPCFSSRDPDGALTAESCDAAACTDFDSAQCATPFGGIRLDAHNSVIERSDDICGIGVCHFTEATGCVKNADGADPFQIGWRDCATGNRTCERDYFPPRTLIAAVGSQGRHDTLLIRIADRTERNGSAEQASPRDFTTFLCVESGASSCPDARMFNITVNASQIRIKDLSLKVGTETIAQLKGPGSNTLHYYSRDSANNVEEAKSMTFNACLDCSPPFCESLNASSGRFVDGSMYTADAQPAFTLVCDEDVNVSVAKVFRGGAVYDLATEDAELSTPSPLFSLLRPLDDGAYNFSFYARNSKGIFMDEPLSGGLFIDTVAPTVAISPADGEVSGEKTVDIALNFSERVIITGLDLDEEFFANDFVKKANTTDLMPLVKTHDNRSFSFKTRDLRGGRHVLRVTAEDFAGNTIQALSAFFIVTGPTDIRLKDPSFGVAPGYVFDIAVETSNPAECRYTYGLPMPPAKSSFPMLSRMVNVSPSEHVLYGFRGIPPGDTGKHVIHVYCKDAIGVSQRSFMLSADTSPPEMLSADASPNPIVESDAPDVSNYSTTLRVRLDEDGFCRASTNTSVFDGMENDFPGFRETPKTSLLSNFTLTTTGSHELFVMCENLAGLRTGAQRIALDVDLSAAFRIRSATPRVANASRFPLRVESNKRSVCYVGESNTSLTGCFGDCGFGRSHSQYVSVPEEQANATFFVKCNTGSSGEEATLSIDVIVDDIPPVVLFVNDSSNYKPDRGLSYFTDRLRVSFLGNDTGSGITQFRLSVIDKQTRAVLLNETSTQTDAAPVWLRRPDGQPFLLNGSTYAVSAVAVDSGGLESFPRESDGVTIDTSIFAESCENEIFDPLNETDADCGGICRQCEPGQRCGEAGDCSSGVCDSRVCAAPSCSDGVLSPGFETDADCGGACDACAISRKCLSDSDCASDFCMSGSCEEPGPCRDRRITIGSSETGVDCGGACQPCPAGEGCKTRADCRPGLNCLQYTCSQENDEDNDGIGDSSDECLGTPASAAVDGSGCSESQRDADADGLPNDWEARYGLDPDDPADALQDTDGDGLGNLDEFLERTDPTDPDTDSDGWRDGREVREGTDPLDADSRPVSVWGPLFRILLWLLVLAALAAAGYIIYQKEKARRAQMPAMRPRRRGRRLVRRKKLSAEARARLREYARLQKLPGGFTTLELVADLVYRGVIRPGDMSAGLRKRLAALSRGELAEVDIKELIRILARDPMLWQKLRTVIQRERAALRTRRGAKKK